VFCGVKTTNLLLRVAEIAFFKVSMFGTLKGCG
jgi:hypothetical protein